jgi:sugar/nucleoside kinase (ribokinase family)
MQFLVPDGLVPPGIAAPRDFCEMQKSIDVYGVGNAIVDMLAMVPFDFVTRHELAVGAMTLMETSRQARILHDLGEHDVRLASGGSAANTMVALAQSGGTGVYYGKAAHDTYGEFYMQDMEAAGIRFPVPVAPEAAEPTGTCVVLTTPDAERTMCTHLGISTSLSVADMDWNELARCRFSYIEGYLWDAPGPREACLEVMRQSRRLGTLCSLTFSDPFLVDRYRDQFLDIIPRYCDLLFCNADEARHLFRTDSIGECTAKIASMAKMVFITDGPRGCIVLHEGRETQVDAFAVNAIDTVGAGDAFAGGVLYGLSRGYSPANSARWGNYLASEVVSRIGPRLTESPTGGKETILTA